MVRNRKYSISVVCGVVTILLAASYSQAENFVSRPVGFVRLTVSTNEQKLVCLPFRPFDTSIDAVLSGQLQGATDERTADRVIKWDSSALKYEHAYKADGTGDKKTDGKWFSSFDPLTPSHFALSPGEGFFLWNRQSVTQEVFLSGEVVLDATNAVTINPSLNLLGYPFSCGRAGRAATAVLDSNGKAPRPLGESGSDAPSFIPDECNMSQGFWVNNTSMIETVWLETRPYQDVFPEEGERPSITGLQVRNGNSVVLTVVPAGEKGEKLDIYYKDVQPAEGFESERGWLIAETDIPVRGGRAIEWVDAGSFSRKPVNEVFARYYLVGRADIDADKDGAPDARQKFVFGKPVLADAGSVESARGTNSTLVSEVSTNLTSSTNAVALRFPPAAMLARVIYVDRKVGADTLSGKSPVVAASDGPKKTIHGGLNAVKPGEMMIIKSGTYNEDMNIAGRVVHVRVEGTVNLWRHKFNQASATNQVFTPPVPGTNVVNKSK